LGQQIAGGFRTWIRDQGQNRKMWTVPNAIVLTKGVAEGITELNALDNALLKAGAGNLNLVKVTSVLPPDCEVLSIDDPLAINALVPGLVTPCVLSYEVSTEPGTVVSANVSVAVPKDGGNPGMIYEHRGREEGATVEASVRAMALDAMQQRGIAVEEVLAATASHRVSHIGCAVAVALLLRLME